MAADPSRITLHAPGDGSFLVHGAYPHERSRCKHPEQPTLLARYPGTLTIRRADGGRLDVTLTLSFERYLEGIAEVPPTWPLAALEAQAIAARTYALASIGWSGPPGATLGTPICATASCQVYGGIPVPPEPGIGRWYRAVRRTANRVLLFRSRPADTLYFSTSNGHTFGNDQVFGSAPLPYLRPVAEHDDGASPEAHWRVPIPLRDLTVFLRASGLWTGGRRISTVRRAGSVVVVSGHGARRSFDVSELRDALNQWAPCLEPKRFPSDSSHGSPLPQTIPSIWLSVAQHDGSVVVTGRGWGHGVGMVQWGAYGKARRGLSAEQILARYYGGLRPRPFPEPGLIHVVVATGLTSLTLRPSAPGSSLDGRRLGPGVLRVTGGDEVRVRRR
jgi:stage II sporulation protein D